MKKFLKIVPWLFFALFAVEIVAVLIPKREGSYHVRAFGRLPVLLNGRVQPFDSVGHNALLQIRSTADVPLEQIPSWQFWKRGKKLRSTEWLLETMLRPDVADTRPIFLIHHPDLLSELKLQEKGIERSGLRYYTFDELKPHLREIWEAGTQARAVQEQQQNTAQKQTVKLQNAVFLYQTLKATLIPKDTEDFAAELIEFERALLPGMAALMAKEAGQSYNEEAYERFWQPLTRFYDMAGVPNGGRSYPLVVPPREPEKSTDEWLNLGSALLESVRAREIFAPVRWYAQMASGYHLEKPAEFNRAVGDYTMWLQTRFPAEVRKGRLEFFYNDTKAFLHAMIIYIFAFLLAGGALMALSAAPNLAESLRKSSLYLVLLAGVVHTAGLVFRMYLEGRPPVTNLYSSAIFIGWGAVILGVILERIFKVGLGVAVASLAGFVTLIIAHNLALGGDTMEMLRAVLDTNFWLATHVVVITLGYASTFVAGLLAIFYIVLGVATRVLTPQLGKTLSRMVYGIVCFATLFSFVGTILGGIWADQSWGRFWGWDPKENGALIIVLWNAVILHARWGGVLRDRGIMNMVVFGNVVTSFSWFGVNMLGIGLHSYGFMDAAFKWLSLFTGSQLLIIGLGLLPLRWWRSGGGPSGPAAGPTSNPPVTGREKPAPAV